MNVYEYIVGRRKEGRLHMTLVDPDKQTAAEAGAMAAEAARAGTDAVMVGGSTGVTQDKVDATILAIKDAAKVPVILFPSNARNLSPHADALYFMSLLNSRDPRLIIGEQRLAAQMLGMKLVYLEAGSGSPEPVPAKVIRAVREAIDIPVVVGGGIRTPEAAKAVAAAGADVVVTGTIVEVAREGDALRRIIEAVKAA